MDFSLNKVPLFPLGLSTSGLPAVPSGPPACSSTEAAGAPLQGLRTASGSTSAGSVEFKSSAVLMPPAVRERNVNQGLDAMLALIEKSAKQFVEIAYPLRLLKPDQVGALAREIASFLESAQRELGRLASAAERSELGQASPTMAQRLDYMRSKVWEELDQFREGVRKQLARAPQDLDFAQFMPWCDGFVAQHGSGPGQPAALTSAALLLELLQDAGRRLAPAAPPGHEAAAALKTAAAQDTAAPDDTSGRAHP